jgi:glycosyltransferase involved in cell wall biosynthesis
MQIVVGNNFGSMIGGAEKVAITTALELSRRGLEVGFFSGGPLGNDFAGSKVRTSSLELRKPSEIGSNLERLEGALSRERAVNAFLGFLGRFPPAETLIHVHSYLGLIPSRAIVRAVAAGYRAVFTCHDYRMACPSGTFYDARREKLCRLRPLSLRCWGAECTNQGYSVKAYRMARSVFDQHIDRTARHVSRFLYVSEFSRRILEPLVGSEGRSQVLYNPCDVVRGAPATPASNARVAWVGRLVPEKNPVLFARATAQTEEPGVFVGRGPLEPQVRAANPDAEITGWLEPREAQARIRSARALVMTSTWYEAAPMVALEALAAGIPLVVPDTCAAREFIREGETGLVFASEDVQDLARTLSMLRDDGLVRRLGRNAYERYWAAPYDLDRHLSSLVDVYREVVSIGAAEASKSAVTPQA